MKNTRKLLSITNLKKYFPVAKRSLFQREQLYVRANEDITLDIYEGETLGVVGESGCGKSTLGRVLLQLYPQTAGTTMYYGVSIDEMTPSYVLNTLTHMEIYRKRLARAEARVAELEAKVTELGGEDAADFYLLQSRNLARCSYQTALNHIVKIVGGFFAHDPDGKGVSLLTGGYRHNVQKNRVARRLSVLSVEISHLEGMSERKKRAEKKLSAFLAEKTALLATLAELDAKLDEVKASLAALRAEYAADAEFAKYEDMRDDGIDLSRLKYSEMRLLRRDLQVIFQDPYSSLNPRFTIGQTIEEGLVTHGVYKHGSQELRDHVVKTMVDCGLQEYMLHRYPHQFSGGQRQRISIARALAVGPKFVVCDECVSALDVSIQSQIINLLQDLKEKQNLTYLFISHDLSVVRYISDRICVMYLGNVVELADASSVFGDPRHPYTVALLSSIPTTDADSVNRERIILEGNIPSPIRPPSGCKFHTRCYMACDKCRRVPPELREVEPGHFVACHFPEKKLGENGKYLFEVETSPHRVAADSDEK